MSAFRPADDPERRKYQNPESIMTRVGLQPGMTFIDAGCGGGFFALPAARIIGKQGKFYGFDENAEAIADLKRLAAGECLDNMELMTGNAEEITLCEKCADIVFFGLVVVHLTKPIKALDNAMKMLKPDGSLSVFDWKKKPTRQGPPLEQRLSEGQTVDLIKEAGFGGVTVNDCGPYHYIITARL